MERPVSQTTPHFGPPPQRPIAPSQQTSDATAGRALKTLLMILISAAAGVSLVHLQPALIIGFTLAVLFVVAVLARPYWGLLLYTCIFIVQPGERYPVLSPLHLERVIGAITLVALVFDQYRNHNRVYIDGTKQTRTLLVFVGVALLTVPFAVWRTAALNGFTELMKTLVFYLLLTHLVDTRKRLRAFISVFSFLNLYMAATALRDYISGSFFFAQGIQRAVGETSAAGDSNALGTTLAVAFPLFLLLGFTKSLGWRRLYFLVGGPILVATLAVTGSRSALLGFLGGLSYLWWTSRRRLLFGLLGALLLLSAFYLLPDQYKTRYSTITSGELDESSQGRITAWKSGMRMLIDRPILGVGISCFSAANGMEYSQGARRSWLQPHSLYVQVPAELGLLGAAAFFAFVIAFLHLNRRTARLLKSTCEDWQYEAKVLDALFAGFVVLLICGGFGHSLLRRTWYIYAAVGASILRIYIDSPARDPRNATPSA